MTSEAVEPPQTKENEPPQPASPDKHLDQKTAKVTGAGSSKAVSHRPTPPPALQDLYKSLTGKIEELEKVAGGGAAEREASKARKKQLREVQKHVSPENKAVSLEDKLTFLSTKFTAMVSELLRIEKQALDTQAQLEAMTKERDKVQAELRKSNMMVDKFQELCRQLQTENKAVFEEAKKVKEEDAAARAAMNTKFQAAVNDVQVKLEAQAAERAAQITENDNLRAKLGEVLQQFETFNQLITKKDLEVQLANARLEQQAAIAETLTKKNELLEQANEQMQAAHKTIVSELETLAEARRTNLALAAANKDLREQLDSYGDKFGTFQKTLEKSNKTFDNLKKELDAGTRARALIQQERDLLRQRLEAAEAAAAGAQKEKTTLSKQVERLQVLVDAVEGVDAEEVKKLRAQKDALEGLCRNLSQQVKQLKGSSDQQPQQQQHQEEGGQTSTS